VLRFLAFVANDEVYGWPSNEYIAKNLEINVRTVRRVLQVFGAIGLITRVDRGPHRVRGLQLNMSMLGGELRVEPATIALAMIDAWKRFQSQGMRLRVRWSPNNFFSEGHWRNSQGWHWDNDALREERLQAEARVGSWR